ncbi:hypothetical protein HQ346_22625 [Rhodococcus sp. BP-252]|uniref:hypothetical protein n=1 Tax=unclassified Rhodococcus (in: high G+C Gram-positive bacteria) TaxID=192944 RepID=UPI001C9AA7F6|nr:MULTISPECIES: hypothetical protein [unclassified Rhodococcus (in: high G+C Gram-positive bacteria)]MBY6414424.1 hypothetical protein [Rhodococcus sp. BP-320]MBY6419141.1 hypothetical protein [Rhodococcus sp. BP-321]MBY6423985.1 hypothetical protein [Rhodococcus sp. BP-324]MBY6429304.1 hypothetical protein [Rhodococcus sp. BP-323]MBY6434265.1 hypothetical protein [Rhodococcus sp. BP-322]
MPVMNMKATRQRLMQKAILNKIERDHLSIDTDAVRQSLETIRRNASRDPLMTSYLDWWEQIIRNSDIETLRSLVQSDDETGNDMRSLSPLYVLLTEPERLQVIDDLRTTILA